MDIVSAARRALSARELRDELQRAGQDHKGPKFYQLMKRLEEGGSISSSTQAYGVAGGDVNRTFYEFTSEGRVAWRLTLEFYATRLKAQGVSAGETED
jgi:hypothetical protein